LRRFVVDEGGLSTRSSAALRAGHVGCVLVDIARHAARALRWREADIPKASAGAHRQMFEAKSIGADERGLDHARSQQVIDNAEQHLIDALSLHQG